ncbi:hypothetical protein PSY49_23705, partial [Shigella flexneri]|nr:hypothetical protein [Shigella flexneri]
MSIKTIKYFSTIIVAIVEKYLIVLIDIVTTQSVLPEQGNTDCVVTMSIKTIKYFSTIIVAIV